MYTLYQNNLEIQFVVLKKSELNEGIKTVTSYGMDENLTFYDILKTDSSVFFTDAHDLDSLRAAIVASGLLHNYTFNDTSYYDEFQIYWPYHDEWDGTTVPVVCVVPQNPDDESALGYIINGSTFTTTTITEDDIVEEHIPAIVVGVSELKYADFPNFKEGKIENNGILWARTFNETVVKPYSSDIRGSDTLIEAAAYKFKSSGTQYDSWVRGGSEFMFYISGVDVNGNVYTNKTCICLSRKEIKKKSEIDIYIYFHFNWQPICGPIAYNFYEHDDWSSVDPIDVNLTYNNSSISTTISINSSDDYIDKGQLYWANYIHSCQTYNNIQTWGKEKIYCCTTLFSTPIL